MIHPGSEANGFPSKALTADYFSNQTDDALLKVFFSDPNYVLLWMCQEQQRSGHNLPHRSHSFALPNKNIVPIIMLRKFCVQHPSLKGRQKA